MMAAATALGLGLALAVPPPDYDPDSGIPPGGGYWSPGEGPGIAPKDGESELLAAYIMLPLGALATASAGAMIWYTDPDHCPERINGLGYNAKPSQCRGLWIYNLIRVSYGSAALVTGAVLLGIGLKRKKAYERWKQRRFQSGRPRFFAAPTRRGASFGFALRF